MKTRAHIDFNVEAIHPVAIEARAPLADRYLVSPFVWEENGALAMLVRAVPKTRSETGNTGATYYGESQDGLNFKMDDEPVIAPSPGGMDVGGCEDPTVVKWQGEYIVYYTGVDSTRCSGQMLYASGPDIHSLKKRGVAHASTKTEGNTKEATIERTADGRWRLFYEYARANASLIGLALGAGVAGPWAEKEAPFAPRPDAWDSWHLSAGPLLTADPDMPVMFYNGATRDARWRIGWIAFDRDCTRVVDRCIQPLIVPPPPPDRTSADIAFAASVIVQDGRVRLYYSLEDKRLMRASIRRS